MLRAQGFDDGRDAYGLAMRPAAAGRHRNHVQEGGASYRPARQPFPFLTWRVEATTLAIDESSDMWIRGHTPSPWRWVRSSLALYGQTSRLLRTPVVCCMSRTTAACLTCAVVSAPGATLSHTPPAFRPGRLARRPWQHPATPRHHSGSQIRLLRGRVHLVSGIVGAPRFPLSTHWPARPRALPPSWVRAAA